MQVIHRIALASLLGFGLGLTVWGTVRAFEQPVKLLFALVGVSLVFAVLWLKRRMNKDS